MEQKPTKKLKLIAIISGALFIILIAIWIFIATRPQETGNVTRTARQKMKNALLGDGKSGVQTVVSKYGFTVTYDKATFNASAHEVAKNSNDKEYRAKTYNNDELKESRGYNLVEIAFKQASDVIKGKDGKISSRTIRPYLTINTSRARNYFDRSIMPEKYRDKKKYSDLDLLAEVDAAKIKETDANAKLTVSKLTISGKEFRKIDQTLTYVNNGTTYETGHAYSYMTVQNGRPYWLRFNAYKGVGIEDYVAQLERIITGVTFQKPDNKLLVGASENASVVLASTSTNSSLSGQDTMNTLENLDTDSIISVVARNQIATVRVASSRCADIKYTADNGAWLQIPNACAGGIGSGSIITNNGYIATNGHVVEWSTDTLFASAMSQANDDLWKLYFEFVINAGYISRADLASLLAKAQEGSADAVSIIFSLITKVPAHNVQVANDESDYVVQTSSDPIRFDGTYARYKWVTTSTNLSAKKIDSEVNMKKSRFDINDKETDVAILKIEGNFPAVELGDSTLLDTGDRLTAIGFPAVVDGGIDTKKEKTVPTVTQGNLRQTILDGGGHKLFFMSTMIASGNSGGPAFDSKGKQVGINTYGGAACEDGKKGNSCFGQGVARDISDLKAMAKKNNVAISADGELTKLWKDGLAQFDKGKYSKAKDYFSELNRLYPQNYLVAKLLKISEETADDYVDEDVAKQYGNSPVDNKSNNTALAVVVVLTITIGLLFIGTSVVVIIVTSDNKRKKQEYDMLYEVNTQTPKTPPPHFQRLYEDEPGYANYSYPQQTPNQTAVQQQPIPQNPAQPPTYQQNPAQQSAGSPPQPQPQPTQPLNTQPPQSFQQPPAYQQPTQAPMQPPQPPQYSQPYQQPPQTPPYPQQQAPAQPPNQQQPPVNGPTAPGS
jgi:peptidase S1 and S6, chymotrypsin/hap